MRGRVELAVQLAHRDRLRVDNRYLDPVLVHQLAILQQSKSACEHPVGRGFPAERQPDDHETVPDYHHLVYLVYLFQEEVGALDVRCGASVERASVQVGVIGGREDDAGEQVGRDTLEKREIVHQKLGQIHVHYASQHEDVFRLLGISELQVARGDQHGLDGPHTVIVVVLAAQLLGAEPVSRHDFNCQRSAVVEPVRVEGVLGDQRVIGHHHRNGAEQRLQIVGQLGSARVTGIHGNEDGAGRIEEDLRALENDLLRPA